MNQHQSSKTDSQQEELNCGKQLEIIERLGDLVKSGEMKNLIVAVKLENAIEQNVVIMADDINMYDFHALVGYLKTDLMLRMMNVQREEESLRRREMLT